MTVQEQRSRELDVEATASWLQETGLVGPAYLLLQGLRPVSFVGGQGLLLVQPMLPLAAWRSAVGRLAGLLSDRSRLDDLLQRLEAHLRDRRTAQEEENA